MIQIIACFLLDKPMQTYTLLCMETLLTIAEASQYLHVSTHTLRRWDKAGRLVPYARTPTHHRRYTQAQLEDALEMAPRKPRALASAVSHHT